LEAVSIGNLTELYEHCRTPHGRARVSRATGLPQRRLLDWAMTADLMRLPDVDLDICRRLRSAGIDSTAELRHRQPVALVRRLRQLGCTTCGPLRAARWVGAARRLATAVVP